MGWLNMVDNSVKCDNCLHSVVCGHKEKWEEYVKEHIKLREKYSLFDEEPECKYYLTSIKQYNWNETKVPTEWIKIGDNVVSSTLNPVELHNLLSRLKSK